MSSILDSLSQELGGGAVRQIGQQLGLDDQRASAAVAAAVPLLLGALSRNASQPGGAESLLGALQRDHDGSLLGNLSGFIPTAMSGAGSGILKHVLGERRNAVTSNLGRATGLDAGKAAALLVTLAPIVLATLGKAQRQKNLNAASLQSLLGGERQELEQRSGAGASLVNSLLDADADGSIADDLQQRGLGMLGKLFGGR